MILTTGDMIAVLIALVGSVTVMCLFWRENVYLQRENRKLRGFDERV
jgi:hypothetical protein